MTTHTTNKEDELEHLAMNIVYQIGDVLYEALPPTIAHEFFVEARQSTNDVAIDFVMKLVRQYYLSLLPEKKNKLTSYKDVDMGLDEGDHAKIAVFAYRNGFNHAIDDVEQAIKNRGKA